MRRCFIARRAPLDTRPARHYRAGAPGSARRCCFRAPGPALSIRRARAHRLRASFISFTRIRRPFRPVYCPTVLKGDGAFIASGYLCACLVTGDISQPSHRLGVFLCYFYCSESVALDSAFIASGYLCASLFISDISQPSNLLSESFLYFSKIEPVRLKTHFIASGYLFASLYQ